jgi:ferredoxin
LASDDIKPTYVGNNENLVFIVPKELFSMKVSPEKTLDPQDAKEFSNYIRGTFKGFAIANKTKLGNENNLKTETNPKFWENFEKKAKAIGVDLIAYTPVDPNYIFKNLKIYGKNAIVLGQEMKWEKINTAPDIQCGIEAFRVYEELGKKTIELTNFLKSEGYKSEAHHPFGGKLLFTAHAVAANLGIMGRNGLILTPEYGPRQRWSIISTDADIPETTKKDFSEMIEYCKKCGDCVKSCRGGAAYEEPIKKEGNIITHIDRSKCIQSLINNNYCSVCLSVCPQGHPKK